MKSQVKLILLVVMTSALTSLIMTLLPQTFTPTQAFERSTSKSTGRILEDEQNTINIYRNNTPSVVNVTNIQTARNFWSFSTIEVPRGAGTGIVWDLAGHIVTNYHVIEGGDTFVVTFHKDHTPYKAKVVGVAAEKDLAVLKLVKTPKNLHPIRSGQSHGLQVGQKVVAIGNPFGFDHTVTSGIISALGRKVDAGPNIEMSDMIQTDASINPGNSGGPLLNSQGELIGLNTLIISQSGTSSGVGFAVPVDNIKRIVPQLIKFGKIIRPGLGIVPLADSYKRELGLGEGVVIAYTTRHGPAAQAGLRGLERDNFGRFYLGDTIIAIDHHSTPTIHKLREVLEKYKVGQKVTVTILRNAHPQKVTLTLDPAT